MKRLTELIQRRTAGGLIMLLAFGMAPINLGGCTAANRTAWHYSTRDSVSPCGITTREVIASANEASEAETAARYGEAAGSVLLGTGAVLVGGAAAAGQFKPQPTTVNQSQTLGPVVTGPGVVPPVIPPGVPAG